MTNQVKKKRTKLDFIASMVKRHEMTLHSEIGRAFV